MFGVCSHVVSEGMDTGTPGQQMRSVKERLFTGEPFVLRWINEFNACDSYWNVCVRCDLQHCISGQMISMTPASLPISPLSGPGSELLPPSRRPNFSLERDRQLQDGPPKLSPSDATTIISN